MKVELILAVVLGLGAGSLATLPAGNGDRMAQCVPTELPSPRDGDETPPSPKPSA